MIQDWLRRLGAFWSTNRRNQIIVTLSCVVGVTLLVFAISFANRGGATSARGVAQATATPAPQATATLGSTPQPTATVGPTATPLPTSPVNEPILGGTENGFTTVYGAPTATGVDSGNNLPTVTYKGSGPIGSISIELASDHSYVSGIVVSAQKNSPWNLNTLSLICPHFAPPDTTLDAAQPVTDNTNQTVALYQLGHSQTLASTLPGSVFTDNQGQPVTNGTFTTEIYYIAGSDAKYAYACSLRLGDQPVSPAG